MEIPSSLKQRFGSRPRTAGKSTTKDSGRLHVYCKDGEPKQGVASPLEDMEPGNAEDENTELETAM